MPMELRSIQLGVIKFGDFTLYRQGNSTFLVLLIILIAT